MKELYKSFTAISLQPIKLDGGKLSLSETVSYTNLKAAEEQMRLWYTFSFSTSSGVNPRGDQTILYYKRFQGPGESTHPQIVGVVICERNRE